MNIHLQDVHVTLVISPTDLRCGYHRLHSIAQDQLGINLNDGKEAVVFISKTRRICKIITSDNRGTMLLTRTLHMSNNFFVYIVGSSRRASKVRFNPAGAGAFFKRRAPLLQGRVILVSLLNLITPH